jgi:putative DNA methylase
MNEERRLIEVAFPLKQTSLDSVHEKNVRHGHISTLHIWPARRPLAASRAALIATLLPDPGNAEERKQMLERLGGRLVTRVKSKKLPDGRIEEQTSEETEGGILHWGRESSADLDWFREKIRAAYGGRTPRVLDPFAGGGAIPLEAMRLGCDVTAVDINPVAWFILKCTLEYPQRLANQHRPLPAFARQSAEFMEHYFKAKGFKGAALQVQLASLGFQEDDGSSQPTLTGIKVDVASVEADLAWHVRAWGWWVLQQAKTDLARFYPTVDGKPTVAYLWARTVTCKNCRATIPLLKTRWLCKKDKQRVVITMEPNADKTGVVFGVQENVPHPKGTLAQRGEAEKLAGGGTMSGSGATCPCCGTIMTREDLQQAGLKGNLGTTMTAVAVEGQQGKEYRLPTEDKIRLAIEAENQLTKVFTEIPFGIPEEHIPQGASRASGGSSFTVRLYGLTRWRDLFTPRQLLALGVLVKHVRTVISAMKEQEYSSEWIEAVNAYLALSIDRFLDFCNSGVQWKLDATTINHYFVRFALSFVWDFAEGNTIGDAAGSYELCYERICTALDTFVDWGLNAPTPKAINASAISHQSDGFDAIITDPPYYDAISYSDLMDFFYVWLRRILYGLSPEIDAAFERTMSPKWDHERNDGELIDEAIRFNGDNQKSKANYEDGMARAFQSCYKALQPDGRLVVVFAHKHPDAWETLVTAIIRAGFVVDGSWPIQTEMGNRTRAFLGCALLVRVAGVQETPGNGAPRLG